MLPRVVLHPLCDVFPPLHSVRYGELKNDIQANGLKEPITFWRGLLLDGKARWSICGELGIQPCIRDRSLSNDPISIVVSANLNSRALNADQRAIVAAKLSSLRPKIQKAKWESGLTVEQAASTLGVKARMVWRAKFVLPKASPTTLKYLSEGKISLWYAERIVREYPKIMQNPKLFDQCRPNFKGEKRAAAKRLSDSELLEWIRYSPRREDLLVSILSTLNSDERAMVSYWLAVNKDVFEYED